MVAGTKVQKNNPWLEDHQGHLINRYNSALEFINIFRQFYQPKSVVDLGCGVGAWLKAWQDSGTERIKGLDLYTTSEALLIDENCLEIIDLNTYKLAEKQKFDLAMSLEVAEHLDAKNAKNFVELLTSLSDVVLFSAAIPMQPGNGHVNCQFLNYWVDLFNSQGYECLDFIRALCGNNQKIEWWYRQNSLVFVKKSKVSSFTPYLEINNTPTTFYVPELQNMIFPMVQDSLECCTKIHSHLSFEEKFTLYSLVEKLPENAKLVEIGSYLGASSCILAKALKSGQIFCIDTWENNAMTDGVQDTYTDFMANTADFKDKIAPMRMFSSEAIEHLQAEKLDFLFIDGDHRYEAVKADWEAYSKILKDDAIVVFHDIGWEGELCGVPTFLQEKIFNHFPIIAQLPNMLVIRYKKEYHLIDFLCKIKYSIIIPTYNCADKLQLCLEQISKLKKAKQSYELLIIDNGSTDHTSSVALAFKDKIDNFNYIFNSSPGLHSSRHLGAMKASGEVLCYLDDDSLVTEDWLLAIEDNFNKPEVLIATGNVLPYFQGEVPKWLHFFWQNCEYGRYLSLLSLLSFYGQKMKVPTWFVFGCNFVIRKSVLFELGGFNPDSLPKDFLKFRGDGETALAFKLNNAGVVAHYDPAMTIYHFIPEQRLSEEYLLEVSFRNGISQSFTDIRNDYYDLNYKYEANQNVDHTDAQLNYDDLINEFGLSQEDYDYFLTIKAKLDQEFRAGYNYHNGMALNDEGLFAWVIKENYLN